MITLDKILNLDIKTEYNLENIINSDKARKIEISEIIPLASESQSYVFENQVFNYLFSNKTKLNINKIYRFHNSLIDGYIEFENEKIILVEIKYVLNWLKVCNARIQFNRFINRKIFNHPAIDINESNILGGYIIFNNMNEIKGNDWGGRVKERKYLNGWYRFYEEQADFENDFKIRILRLNNNILSYEPY